MSLYQAIKDNWAQVSFVFVVLSILVGVIGEWRIRANVATALASTDLATDLKIIDMDKATATNTSGVAENKGRIGGLDRRTELAFAALMGRPAPAPD